MAAFGDELRLERESRGRSLEWLSAETKVNTRYLLALERGAFHELPGGVFRKGILRSYVGSLGLDEAEWIARFDQNMREIAPGEERLEPTGEEAWFKFAPNVKRSRMRRDRSTRWRWLGIVVVLIALGCTCWAIWRFELRALLGR